MYNVFRLVKRNTCSSPGNYFFRGAAMIEVLKTELLRYIDQLDEYQLHILLGFVKRLFDLHD